MRTAGFLLLGVAVFAGCSSSGGSASHINITPTSVPSVSPSPTSAPSGGSANCSSPAATAQIGPSGGSVTTAGATGTFTETFPAGAFSAATTVSLCYVASNAVPSPLRVRHAAIRGGRTPQFTQGAGNTYIVSFTTSFGGATPAIAPTLTGTGIVPSSIPANTQLNIAFSQNSSYTDIGTALVGANQSFQSTPVTVQLPGIRTPGTYLVYAPAAGTNTAQINLGFALIADDGTASTVHGLQFIQVEDGSGNLLPTPTSTYFPLSAASDLDGQALTPDASRGAVIDGGNSVYFFSGLPQHQFVISPTTVDVTAYGGDGDSIVSLPRGDEVVVSADNGDPLAVISGILTGNPVVADTISDGGQYRDGLVISNDGSVMLSRGYSGIDVYSIASVAAHAGSTNQGTTSYNFTLTQTLASPGTVGYPYLEDGRDDMAMSPTDGTRALVAGEMSGGGYAVQLLTNLGGGAAVVQSLPLRLPNSAPRRLPRGPEPSHRLPAAVTLTSGTTPYAVTISPDGTTGYIGTNAGVVTIGGVNTGTLVQLGTIYNPSVTVGSSTCSFTNNFGSIGVTPDGKYLEATLTCGLASPNDSNTDQGSGVLISIPIGAGGALGNVASQLNYIVTPYNDQMIIH